MAAGVPLVCQNQWGWPEMIEDGTTGFLTSDDEEMEYRLAQLAYDEELQQDIARRARSFVEFISIRRSSAGSGSICFPAWRGHDGKNENCLMPDRRQSRGTAMTRILIGALSGWKYAEPAAVPQYLDRRRICECVRFSFSDVRRLCNRNSSERTPWSVPARTTTRACHSGRAGSAAGPSPKTTGTISSSATTTPTSALLGCRSTALRAGITWAPSGNLAWATEAAGPDIF